MNDGLRGSRIDLSRCIYENLSGQGSPSLPIQVTKPLCQVKGHIQIVKLASGWVDRGLRL